LSPSTSTTRSELALDLVDEIHVEMQEPAQEIDHQQQVPLTMREPVSALFRGVEPPPNVGYVVVSSGRSSIASQPLT
jgi:hypothetical protein